MSTVIDDQKKTAARGSATRTRRPATSTERTTRSKAAQRALDRRERRLAPNGPVATATRKRIGGVPLVFPVLLLIVGALGLTLYLTTKSAQDSYALDAMRKQNQTLQDKRDDLKRQHDLADSAPALAAKAGELGMVPSDGAVQIIIGPDGKPRRVGAPVVSDGATMPDLNPEPDPVDKIDPKDVDDSQGLTGSGAGGAETTQTRPTQTRPTQTRPAQPSNTAPSNTAPTTDPAPTSGPRPNVRPNADPTRQVRAPRADVTGPADATPGPNAAPAR